MTWIRAHAAGEFLFLYIGEFIGSDAWGLTFGSKTPDRNVYALCFCFIESHSLLPHADIVNPNDPCPAIESHDVTRTYICGRP